MYFDEVIDNRRSARLFTNDVVSENQLTKILLSNILAPNLGLGSCILCDTLYIEDEINQYLGIKNFEQICGFIIGNPIYSYPPKQKKTLNNLLLN